MPLYKKIVVQNSAIAIWRIEEPASFFASAFEQYPEMLNESKRLQWLATRYLANEILGAGAEIIKDEAGKPWLKDSAHHISISHTAQFAGVALNTEKALGIDIETVNPKVLRVANRFLTEEELSLINDKERIEKLILYWSAKESLYKLYGKGQIEFKTQLLIDAFDLKSSGELNAAVFAPDKQQTGLSVHYEFFEGHVLTYVVGR